MSNQAKRLSDCAAERLAQCRGQVEVVAYHIVDEFGQKKVLLPGAEGIARHRSRGALMRPLTDVGHANRLQAEVSALQQRLNIADQRVCDQQSELNKARESSPINWTDRQVLDFLGVALRNVDLVGEVRLGEIRQGFQFMQERQIANFIDCKGDESCGQDAEAAKGGA